MQILVNYLITFSAQFLKIGMYSIVAVTDFSVTPERGLVIDFPHPITTIYHKFFIRNPLAGRINYFAYFEPLKSISWIAIGIFAISTPPFLYFVTQ